MTNKKKIVSLYFKYFLCCLFPLSVWVWVGMVNCMLRILLHCFSYSLLSFKFFSTLLEKNGGVGSLLFILINKY